MGDPWWGKILQLYDRDGNPVDHLPEGYEGGTADVLVHPDVEFLTGKTVYEAEDCPDIDEYPRGDA